MTTLLKNVYLVKEKLPFGTAPNAPLVQFKHQYGTEKIVSTARKILTTIKSQESVWAVLMVNFMIRQKGYVSAHLKNHMFLQMVSA
jgi:hypothetical protein